MKKAKTDDAAQRLAVRVLKAIQKDLPGKKRKPGTTIKDVLRQRWLPVPRSEEAIAKLVHHEWRLLDSKNDELSALLASEAVESDRRAKAYKKELRAMHAALSHIGVQIEQTPSGQVARQVYMDQMLTELTRITGWHGANAEALLRWLEHQPSCKTQGGGLTS